MGDSFAIAKTKEELKTRLIEIKENKLTEEEFKSKWRLGKNYAKWFLGNIDQVQINDENFVSINYRPFDTKWTYFDNRVIWRWREKIMKHFLIGKNIGLVLNKTHRCGSYRHVFLSKNIVDFHVTETANANPYCLPLYLYHSDNTKTPNFDLKIWKEIDRIVGKTEPEDVLDYIYAVLHSPSYREKYKEFLKIDFPRVPYPKDKKTFWKLVKLGRELRGLHLLESPKVSDFITTFPVGGTNIVDKISFKKDLAGFKNLPGLGSVYLNETQYFGNVPESAWNFYIGGYQPAQKWLKDRRGRELSVEDIEHYQKMIVALSETGRIMEEIDKKFSF